MTTSMGLVGAIQRGGGELVMAQGTEPDKVAVFKKRYPNVKWAATEDEILHDPSIQLVLSSKIASERAALGVRVMRAGQGFSLRQARRYDTGAVG